MKNDENVEVWTDPEQEAKVVAMLMGELSAFEMAELEENLAQSPELRVFRDRMVEVQALITEVNEQENEEDDWKLSTERRADLLENISQPVRVEKVEVRFSQESKDMTKIQWQTLFSIAACLIVSLILTVVVFPFKRFTKSQVDSRKEEIVTYSAQNNEEKKATRQERENLRKEIIAKYKQKIEAQENKVEDNRARLYKLSKSIGIPYHGVNSQVASTQNRGRNSSSIEVKSMNSAEDHTQFGKVKEEYEREFAVLQSLKSAEFRETITNGLETDPVAGEYGRKSNALSTNNTMKRQFYRDSRTNQSGGRANLEAGELDDLVWVDEEITKPEMSSLVERKPSLPSSSLAKVIAAKIPSPTAVPVPDIALLEPSLDFGDGDDFGEGFGEGGGNGGDFGSITNSSRSGKVAFSGASLDGRINGLSESGKYAYLPNEKKKGANKEVGFKRTDGKNLPTFSDDAVFIEKDGSLVTQEITRRLASVAEADKSIVNGRDAYTKKNYEQAVDEYKKALNLLPQGPIARDRRASYAGHLVDSQIALSNQYKRTGRLDDARKLINDALEADPGNVLALKQLQYLDDPIRTSPTLSYEHVENVEKVRNSLYKSESLYNQGQFDEATKEYKEILRLDPYNKAARRGMEKVTAAKNDYYRAAYDQTRAKMLMEVDKSWGIAKPPAQNGGRLVENKSLTTRKKLQNTTLENIEFSEDTTVRQAINFLRLRSRELDHDGVDPSKRGINFKFRDNVVADSDVDGFSSVEEAGGFDGSGKIENIKLGKLNLRNVPMEEVVKQIAQKTGLRYKVEGNDIVLLRGTDVDESEMFTRTFRVPKDFIELLKDLGKDADSDPFSGEEYSEGKPSINELIQKNGIPMPEGSTALYSKERGLFTIRNTTNVLDIIEEMTAQLAVESEKKKAAKTLKHPKPQTLPNETSASEKADSTFSLNVSDVSFELARVAMLEKNTTPEVARIRPEEFVNAFDYGDPSASGKKVTCAIEQCAHPMLQQRNLMRIGMKTGAIGRSKPLRLTILLDNSGSMEREDREATVLKALEALASKLGPQDEVTLLSFARNSRLVAQKIRGDQAGKLVRLVKSIPSEGGTNLSRAITQAHFLAKKGVTKQTMSRVVLITDGAANLGNADPDELAESIVSMRRDGIAFDACGVGADGLDDDMLETLTRKGDGRYYFINKAKDADAEFAEKLAGALRPAAKNVKVQVIFNPERVGNYRLLGFEKHLLKKEDFRNDKVDAAEMAAEEAGNALYQVEALPDGLGDIGRVFVRFMDMESGQMVERSWTIPYDPQARNIIDAKPSMQLASVAGLLGERLKFGEPASIDLSRLKQTLGRLRVHFHSDKKVQDLIRMTEKASR